MTRAYRLVVFDWDGTLADSTARIVTTVQAAIAAAGLPARTPERIRSIIGLGLDPAIDALFPDAPAAARQRLTHGYRETLARHGRTLPVALFAGADAALARLDAGGCMLAIATGKSRRGLRQDLHDTGLGDRFTALRTVDECPSKPDPAMVEELMIECAADARETVVVGDTLFDLEMAANAGVDAIAVSWGAHAPEQLERAGPRGLLRDFEELDRWVLPAGRQG